jgi:DNA replication protein DnaC
MEEVGKIKSRRIYIKLSPDEFQEIFMLNAKIEMAKRNKEREFEIDENNKLVINQLYLYLIGSDKFKGDLNRGIMLSGNVGTGKTMMINAFLGIIQQLSNKIVTSLHAKKVSSYLKEKGDDYLIKRPLFIDDLGKETKIVNDYGTVKNTIPDLFAIRYDTGAWTFATNNYSFDTLQEFYGETIVDRFKEMFNNLKLTGDSRRR